MPSWIVPSDSHVVGDTGHTTDHNHMADDLNIVNNFAPVVSGGLTGATAATRWVGATASTSPSTGTFAVGDFDIDQSGRIWVCTTAGSPGTWTPANATLMPYPIYNAKFGYGAVGNGSTDDTTALTNWINALNAAASGLGTGVGATGYLPTGEYMVSGPLPTITSDAVTIIGDGWAYDSASSHHGSCIVANGSYVSATAILSYTGTGCCLTQVSIDGGAQASTVVNWNGDRGKMLCAQIRNATSSGTLLNIGSTGSALWVGAYSSINGVTASTNIGILVGSHDVLIQGIKIDNCNIAIEINGSGGGTQIQNNHLTPATSGTNAIWINGSPNDIMITGNRFDNCGNSDIQITCGASAMHDVQITGNQFQNQGYSATTWAHVAVDTTNHAVNGLQINNNACYAGGANVAGYMLAALTQAGGTPSNPTTISTAGSQANGNVAYLTNSSFWAASSSPTQARGNLVSTNGTSYSSVTDI